MASPIIKGDDWGVKTMYSCSECHFTSNQPTFVPFHKYQCSRCRQIKESFHNHGMTWVTFCKGNVCVSNDGYRMHRKHVLVQTIKRQVYLCQQEECSVEVIAIENCNNLDELEWS